MNPIFALITASFLMASTVLGGFVNPQSAAETPQSSSLVSLQSEDFIAYEFSMLSLRSSYYSDVLEQDIRKNYMIHYKDYILKVDSTVDYDEAQLSGKLYINPPMMEIILMSKKGLKYGMHYIQSAKNPKSYPTGGYARLKDQFGVDDLVNLVNQKISTPLDLKIKGSQQIETYVFKNDEIEAMDTLVRVFDASFNDMYYSLSKEVDKTKPNKLVRNRLILHQKSVDSNNKKPIPTVLDIQIRKIGLSESTKKKYLEVIKRFEADILKSEYQVQFVKIDAKE